MARKVKEPLIYVLDRIAIVAVQALALYVGIQHILQGDMAALYELALVIDALSNFTSAWGDYEYDTKGVSGWRL